jgi:hypothetical protein
MRLVVSPKLLGLVTILEGREVLEGPIPSATVHNIDDSLQPRTTECHGVANAEPRFATTPGKVRTVTDYLRPDGSVVQ